MHFPTSITQNRLKRVEKGYEKSSRRGKAVRLLQQLTSSETGRAAGMGIVQGRGSCSVLKPVARPSNRQQTGAALTCIGQPLVLSLTEATVRDLEDVSDRRLPRPNRPNLRPLRRVEHRPNQVLRDLG